MSYTPSTPIGKLLARWSFIVISLGAIIGGVTGAYKKIGLPALATENDVNSLKLEFIQHTKDVNRDNARRDMELYSGKIQRYLLLPTPESQVQKQFLEEELNKARRELQDAETRYRSWSK